ncbi:MAG TPA: RT0821/Lpp0805 family surface protein [Candidatus Saccharimonadales bacterium]|nr:RT0821/Lpp0805 family surface protein [Candidatus Saccharimonadales bacterium]
MNKLLTNIFVLLLSISLISCSTNTQKENTGIGVATGAIAGGLLGSLVGGGTGKAVAIGVGIVAGALVGGAIGHSMDSSDQAHMNNAVTTGKPATWKNSKTHSTYTVVPSKKYVTVKGNPYCRNYTTTAVIDGKTSTVHGVACRQSDGSWKAVQ